MQKVSPKTIGRLSLYRGLLENLRQEGNSTVFSHELAAAANCSAAQVRRDLMSIEYSGSPVHGYQVTELIDRIDIFLDRPEGTNVALVGVGNLGRAVLDYFRARRPKISIVAAFDINENKTDRVILGCPVYPMSRLADIVTAKNILVGIVTVPAASAQQVAERLIRADVKGILNFAPIRLKVPHHVYVEDVDITMCLEKVAYFSWLRTEERGVRAS